MARPGPRHAEPENLAVDGAADHGCNGLPLRADCQRQRPEPVKQDMPGFAAPPTGPNQVGKLASADTRPPTTKSRNDAIARVKLASARGVVDGLRLVRLTDPNTGEAIPTSLVADDKGPFGFEHGIAPPQPRHTRVKTQTTDPEPRPESGPSKD